MPQYVLHRDYTLRTTFGHSIKFKKNQPVHVPSIVEQEAVAIGAIRADGDTPTILKDEAPVAPEVSYDERVELLRMAMESIEQTNNPDDFKANAEPKVSAVERIVGFNVDAREVSDAWKAYRLSKA